MTTESKASNNKWIAINTNQIRLRHLRQVSARCVTLQPPAMLESSVFYYTLHITMMSAPFYTSETLSGENMDWSDVDIRKYPENIATSCPGVIVRLWSREGDENSTPSLITTWGVFFSGLVYLGSQLPKEGFLFAANTIIFGMSWGYFVDAKFIKTQFINQPSHHLQDHSTPSYSVPNMCRLHRMQRGIYKEASESERLRQEIQLVQSNPSRYRSKSMRSMPLIVSSSPIDLVAVQELKAKRQVALARVSMLKQERAKQSRQLEQLRETLKTLRVDNHTRALHLKEKYFHLQMDKERLSELVGTAAATEEQVMRLKQQLNFRRQQLFQELSEIYPIVQTDKGLYSINDVVLPSSDSLTGYDEIQLSTALGHVTHLVQMISVFLQVPNRYPMTVCSSRSRILDQASQREEVDAQREFPLYAKGKDRMYFEYAVYLLNKNIAQLRWLCGQNTTDLAATLPNLSALLQHLRAPPPSEEITKKKRSDSVSGRIFRSGSISSSTASLNQPIKSVSKWQTPHRIPRSLAGSHVSLVENSMASTVSLDQLTDSPKAGGYFKQMPSQSHPDGKPWTNCSQSSSSTTLSLDLAVDHLRLQTNSPISTGSHPDYHGSAPDLLQRPELNPNLPLISSTTTAAEAEHEEPAAELVSTESEPVKEQQQHQVENGDQAEASAGLPEMANDPLFIDDGMDSVSAARLEALAVCSTFKLKGRGRTPSTAQGNA